MQLEDLLRESGRTAVEQSAVDPLRHADALQEAQLLDVRVEALSSRIGMLFELRTAMNLAEGNTGLLVARAVHEFTWAAEARATDKTAWNVIGSEPRVVDGKFVLELYFFPNARVSLVAEKVEFHVGDVDGLSEQLPDYGEDDDATIRANLPGWRSSFSPIWTSFVDGGAS
jgi:hypothetical protein